MASRNGRRSCVAPEPGRASASTTSNLRPDPPPKDDYDLALETSVPGLFAAGDARHGSTERVAGAVGDGAMATALAHRRLAELHDGR